MTVWTFKTSSDFGNELFLDIALDGINGLDDVEESLRGMELRPGTGCPDASVTESLNTFWKNMLEVKTQEFEGIDRFGEVLAVTVLRKLVGSETKRDVLSVVGKDVTFRKESSLCVGGNILDGVDTVPDVFDVDDAPFAESFLRDVSRRFQRIDFFTEYCGENRFDGSRMKEELGISEVKPMRGILGQCSACNDNMGMRMVVSVTSPGLVGHEECGFSVKLGIESLLYGFRGGFEKDSDCILWLTLENDGIFVGQRERNEEIRDIEVLLHSGIDPRNDSVLSAVRTVPVSAGAEPELRVAAMRAHASNPSRKRSAAGKNIADRMEDRFGYAVCAEECGTMVADDVCETGHASVGQIISQLFDEFGVLSTAHLGIMDVVGGGSQAFMTEDVLNSLGTGVQLNEVRGTAMAEHVRRDALFDAIHGTDAVVQRLDFAERNVFGSEKNDFAGRLADLAEGKQELRMSVNLPALFEMGQHFSLDGNLSDLIAFPFDDQISICSVDVMNREMGCFGITEAAGVHQFGQDSEYQIVDQREKVSDFLLRQNLPVSPVFLRMKDVQERSEQIQSLLIEKQ